VIRHNNEPELMKFVTSSGDHGYTLETIAWLRDRYPGSLPSLEPKLRQLADQQLQKINKKRL